MKNVYFIDDKIKNKRWIQRVYKDKKEYKGISRESGSSILDLSFLFYRFLGANRIVHVISGLDQVFLWWLLFSSIPLRFAFTRRARHASSFSAGGPWPMWTYNSFLGFYDAWSGICPVWAEILDQVRIGMNPTSTKISTLAQAVV